MLYIISHLGNTNQNTVKHHFILTRMVTIKKTDNNKSWQGTESLEPLCTVGGLLIIHNIPKVETTQMSFH